MKTTPNDVLSDDPATESATRHPDTPPSPELAMIVRSFASVLLGQAVADGEVHAAEMRNIERILQRTFYLGYEDTKRFVREALDQSVAIGSLAFENSLEALRERFLPHQRKRFCEALQEVAESDGYIDDREILFSAYVTKRLGIEKLSRASQ